MLSDYDLLFEPLGIENSVPQWNVFVGGKQIAYVVERTMAFPTYRVSISGLEDQFFVERKEVVHYLLTVIGAF